MHRVLEFFEARKGPLVGFRYRDPLDWKSCSLNEASTALDQLIGQGQAGVGEFQLRKTYGTDEDSYVRSILKPVAGTVSIAVDGVEQVLGQDFSVSLTTGRVMFAAGLEPVSGAEVRAGFEFDVPVRFASDQMSISLSSFRAGEVPSIPIVEVVL